MPMLAPQFHNPGVSLRGEAAELAGIMQRKLIAFVQLLLP